MILQPSSTENLSHALRQNHADGVKITEVALRDLRRIVQYTPEDMTVTVEAGVMLADLQRHLATRGQWLPVDPPQAENLTVARLLDTNASGPRRHGYGAVRDHLIGLRVVLADGRIVKSGGQVVKNVAGYDLMKLFVGAFGSLGVIVEATFKLLPLPEAEQFVRACWQPLDRAELMIDAVVQSELTPVVIDLHNVAAANHGHTEQFEIILGFAGTREEVDWESSRAALLGFTEAASLDYEVNFWSRAKTKTTHKVSVLPSRLGSTIKSLKRAMLVARAGNGSIFYQDHSAPPKPNPSPPLIRRIKDAFDPKHVFPEPPL